MINQSFHAELCLNIPSGYIHILGDHLLSTYANIYASYAQFYRLITIRARTFKQNLQFSLLCTHDM